MSKKVVVISASLRAVSNSDLLAKAFAKGAEDAGNEVDFVSLRGKNIAFCTGCMGCKTAGHCVINDDANPIADKVLNADVIAFATPIYYYEMAGQLKTVLDRMNSLYPKDHPFHSVYVLASAAENDPHAAEYAFNGIRGWVECFDKCELKETLFCGGVNAPGEVNGRPEMDQAYQMGKAA